MSLREWLKRLFERAQPVWENPPEKMSVWEPKPVKVKAPRKSKAKKAKKHHG